MHVSIAEPCGYNRMLMLSCSPHPVRMIPDITGAADGEDA
jgi:hypothetical protein